MMGPFVKEITLLNVYYEEPLDNDDSSLLHED